MDANVTGILDHAMYCSTPVVNFKCEVWSVSREISCDFMLVMFKFEQSSSRRQGETGRAKPADDPGPALLAT
jgi:hypothetical protein